MHKKNIILYVMLLFSIVIFAQNTVETNQWYPKKDSDAKVSYNANVNYNINVGSTFSSFGRGFNAFSYYVAPTITFPVGKKYFLSVGIVMNQMQYSGYVMTADGDVRLRNINQTQAIVHASGVYRVNEKVRIFASGYYDMNARNNYLGINNGAYNPYRAEGVSFGAEFILGEKTRIGVMFQYDRGGIYSNPYGGYGAYGGRGYYNNYYMGMPFSPSNVF